MAKKEESASFSLCEGDLSSDDPLQTDSFHVDVKLADLEAVWDCQSEISETKTRTNSEDESKMNIDSDVQSENRMAADVDIASELSLSSF